MPQIQITPELILDATKQANEIFPDEDDFVFRNKYVTNILGFSAKIMINGKIVVVEGSNTATIGCNDIGENDIINYLEKTLKLSSKKAIKLSLDKLITTINKDNDLMKHVDKYLHNYGVHYSRPYKDASGQPQTISLGYKYYDANAANIDQYLGEILALGNKDECNKAMHSLIIVIHEDKSLMEQVDEYLCNHSAYYGGTVCYKNGQCQQISLGNKYYDANEININIYLKEIFALPTNKAMNQAFDNLLKAIYKKDLLLNYVKQYLDDHNMHYTGTYCDENADCQQISLGKTTSVATSAWPLYGAAAMPGTFSRLPHFWSLPGCNNTAASVSGFVTQEPSNSTLSLAANVAGNIALSAVIGCMLKSAYKTVSHFFAAPKQQPQKNVGETHKKTSRLPQNK